MVEPIAESQTPKDVTSTSHPVSEWDKQNLEDIFPSGPSKTNSKRKIDDETKVEPKKARVELDETKVSETKVSETKVSKQKKVQPEQDDDDDDSEDDSDYCPDPTSDSGEDDDDEQDSKPKPKPKRYGTRSRADPSDLSSGL